jgi:hypothetical protein
LNLLIHDRHQGSLLKGGLGFGTIGACKVIRMSGGSRGSRGDRVRTGRADKGVLTIRKVKERADVTALRGSRGNLDIGGSIVIAIVAADVNNRGIERLGGGGGFVALILTLVAVVMAVVSLLLGGIPFATTRGRIGLGAISEEETAAATSPRW